MNHPMLVVLNQLEEYISKQRVEVSNEESLERIERNMLTAWQVIPWWERVFTQHPVGISRHYFPITVTHHCYLSDHNVIYWRNLEFFSGFFEKNIILCILKGNFAFQNALNCKFFSRKKIYVCTVRPVTRNTIIFLFGLMNHPMLEEYISKQRVEVSNEEALERIERNSWQQDRKYLDERECLLITLWELVDISLHCYLSDHNVIYWWNLEFFSGFLVKKYIILCILKGKIGFQNYNFMCFERQFCFKFIILCILKGNFAFEKALNCNFFPEKKNVCIFSSVTETH